MFRNKDVNLNKHFRLLSGAEQPYSFYRLWLHPTTFCAHRADILLEQ